VIKSRQMRRWDGHVAYMSKTRNTEFWLEPKEKKLLERPSRREENEINILKNGV
jgi:hypothetical protein